MLSKVREYLMTQIWRLDVPFHSHSLPVLPNYCSYIVARFSNTPPTKKLQLIFQKASVLGVAVKAKITAAIDLVTLKTATNNSQRCM